MGNTFRVFRLRSAFDGNTDVDHGSVGGDIPTIVHGNPNVNLPMRSSKDSTMLQVLTLCIGLLFASALFAQEEGDGEDPIQARPVPSMKMGGQQAPVVRPPTAGARGATPIEIPFWPAIDPRANPGLFKVLPLPLPGNQVAEGRHGRYAFKRNEKGLIMGQTRYGYAYFHDEDEYLAFLRENP